MDNTCERAFFVGKRVNTKAGFVGLAYITQQVGALRLAEDQKTGEIVFVGLDAFFQYFHAVQRGCEFGTDGGLSAQLFPADDFRRAGRIFSFHDFQTRMPGQEFAALHQGYRMGMYLGDVLYVVVREAKQAVGNAQLMLAYDGKSTVAKQLVIVQQAARYGILDGSHTEYTVVLYRGKYFFKGGAADKF